MPSPITQLTGQFEQVLLSIHLELKGGFPASFRPSAIHPGPVKVLKGEEGSRHTRGRTAKARLLLELLRLFQFSLPLLKLKFQADEEKKPFAPPTLRALARPLATNPRRVSSPVFVCRMGGGDRMIELGTRTISSDQRRR